MAQRLILHQLRPDHIYYSAAVRTTLTYDLYTGGSYLSAIEATSTRRLYGIGSYELIDFVSDLDDYIDHVMIIGHNPTMTDVINMLSSTRLDNLPTGGIAQITFSEKSWKTAMQRQEGNLEFLEFPKGV